MIDAVANGLIALLVVASLALAGEVLTRRICRDAFAWSDSFLVGASAGAVLLFPLTLVSPRHALDAEIGLIVLAVLAAAWRRLRSRTSPRAARPHPGEVAALRGDPIALLLAVAIVAVEAYFVILNYWWGHSWDAIQVYGTKAKMLFFEGGLPRIWFLEQPYDSRLLSYPNFISMLEALFGRVQGTFNLDASKAIFPFFHVCLLLGTYRAARSVMTIRWSLATVLLVAFLPELTSGAAAGGYADMPLAAFVSAITGASLTRAGVEDDGRRRALPWLIGGMTTVKQEGMILALIACGAIVLSWLAERPRRVVSRLRSAWPGAAIVAAFIAARVRYVAWIGVTDTTWGPFDAEHRARIAHLVVPVASLCLRYLLSPRSWGLFWPAFFLAGALMLRAPFSRLAILTAAVTCTILVEASLFLYSNWSLELHIEGSYTRLLAQLAPAAAVVIGAAGQRTWSTLPPKAA